MGSAIDSGRMMAARQLLDRYLEESGVSGSAPPRRYLWTDAFAVCALLELHASGLLPGPGATYLSLAERLVEQVHHTLGRHRPDDPRSGWISGLDEAAGEAHPTAGGLRIGKPDPERALDAPADPGREWDRDGQYFHYLTRWMHALLRMSQVTGEEVYLTWGIELAHAAYRGFLQDQGPGAPRLAWKMSVDLSRPQVETPGHHDALDGWITFLTLEAAASEHDADALTAEILALREMSGVDSGTGWATEDPLGLGGLLVDAWRVAQLDLKGQPELLHLLELLLASADAGFRPLLRTGLLQTEPSFRLPFRELGLSLGLHALEALAESPVRAAHGVGADQRVIEALIDDLRGAVPLAHRIEETWLDPHHQTLPCWMDHQDINTVMLASSLVPAGYLTV